MSDKKFKDTAVGKIVWKLGDALKGKGRLGKAAEVIGEAVPFVNPVRVAKAVDRNKKIEKLKQSPNVRAGAQQMGVELDDLLDDSPEWFRMAVIVIIVAALIAGVYLGFIPAEVLLGLFGFAFAQGDKVQLKVDDDEVKRYGVPSVSSGYRVKHDGKTVVIPEGEILKVSSYTSEPVISLDSQPLPLINKDWVNLHENLFTIVEQAEDKDNG